MRTTQHNGTLRVFAEAYSLVCPNDRPYVYLHDAQGKRLAELFVLSGVNPQEGRDDTLEPPIWQVSQEAEEIVLAASVRSTAWNSKTYRFRCLPTRLAYEIEVEGQGRLWDVTYFGGYYSGQVRWGSGFMWSGHGFEKGFNPEPNTDERAYFSPEGCSQVDLTGVPLPVKGGWFFTPPPFWVGLKAGQQWLGLGVEEQQGANTYTEYTYHGQRGGFYLSLNYEGYTQVDGRRSLPSIGFDFAPDEYSALAAHINALRDRGFICPTATGPKPLWWQEPIFCGWGAQCGTANLEKAQAVALTGSALSVESAKAYSAPRYSRQELYEGYLSTLESHGVEPGIVVLDDKWQATYGENLVDEQKWPDLRGFIDRQHALGRKVLLWLKAWDPEGLPPEECIRNRMDLPVAVDPTHPDFERRLRASVQQMLSNLGYDADGFKIDFTARIPSGPGMSLYGEAWGLELMKRYLGILSSEARRLKPEALVMTHTPHPYLADVVDMIRLNDINANSDVNQAMQRRAQVAAAACPGTLIDTDNWPMDNMASWRRYLRLQPELGVPSLYYVTHIDATMEPLTERDYRMIRETWEAYRQLAGLRPARPKRLRMHWPGPRTRIGKALQQAYKRWLRRRPRYEPGWDVWPGMKF